MLVFPPLFSLPQSSGGFPSMVWAGFPLFPALSPFLFQLDAFPWLRCLWALAPSLW